MPVEKLRELDDCSSPTNVAVRRMGVDGHQKSGNKENGVTSASTSPNTKNGLLHKSGGKLGFSKRKTPGEANGHHLAAGAVSFNGQGKRIDDPFRFSGDGIDFKAKLIGIRDVSDARGDQMCQDSIQLCKALIKSSGQHKKRILFNVSVEGLKIKELSNGHTVHSFPVNKVSFIAKDVTDNRAFGFVYGSPEEKHKFYAIKTEKTSDQVVLSIRDMFHVVYEMKKKQIDDAKQGKDSKGDQHSNDGNNDTNGNFNGETKDENGVAVADLLDLETELQNLKQGVQDINTAWDDFNPRAGETQVLSTSLSSASFGNGYHAPFYRGHQQASAASSPDFFSLGSAPSSLNETVSSSNGVSEDPFGTNAFTPPFPVSESTSPASNPHNVVPMVNGVAAAVPPPPPTACRRRTTSSNGNQTNNLLEPAVNGDNHIGNDHTFLIDRQIPSVQAQFHSAGAFESPAFAVDPFDTSHVSRLVNGVGSGPGYAHHAASTPIQRFSSTASPQFGQGAISFEMSHPPSAITGTRSSVSEFSSPGSVFGTTGPGYKMASTPNDTGISQNVSNSVLNQAMCGSQLSAMQEPNLLEPSTPESQHSPSFAFEATPLACENGTSDRMTDTDAANGLQSTPLGNNTYLMSSSPLQSLLSANVLKAPNATSVDQAFNVLCNLDTLANSPSQQASNMNGAVYKEDLFAQMRPPPKKSINELRGSPPTASSSPCSNAVSLSSLDGLYASSPNAMKSTLLASANAPPVPPRPSAATNGLLPPPSSAMENVPRHNRRALPQPIPNANGVGGLSENYKSHDPFADDPFFAS